MLDKQPMEGEVTHAASHITQCIASVLTPYSEGFQWPVLVLSSHLFPHYFTSQLKSMVIIIICDIIRIASSHTVLWSQ